MHIFSNTCIYANTYIYVIYDIYVYHIYANMGHSFSESVYHLCDMEAKSENITNKSRKHSIQMITESIFI